MFLRREGPCHDIGHNFRCQNVFNMNSAFADVTHDHLICYIHMLWAVINHIIFRHIDGSLIIPKCFSLPCKQHSGITAKKFRSHKHSLTATAKLLNSTSNVLCARIDCRLLRQLIATFPKLKTYPLIDFPVGFSCTQSASQYAIISGTVFTSPFVNSIPASFVSFTYLNTS